MNAVTFPPHRARVAWVFGDSFDIDQIVGVSNIKIQELETLGDLAMAQFESGFRHRVRAGDVLVGGRNFGYGHPHAAAMRAMRHIGIAAVLAESFFSSYWIGEIGNGFMQLVCPGISTAVARWDVIDIDVAACRVHIPDKNMSLALEPYSARDAAVLAAGGLKELLRRQQLS
jgi:3-isopropylmalate/(R)-2-methylmalate dehydratase small subunit